MATANNDDLEKSNIGDGSGQRSRKTPSSGRKHNAPNSLHFAGRLGGNQAFTIDPKDADNASILADEPDAAPGMSLKQQFDLRPFKSIGLWKVAMVEGFGKSVFHSFSLLLGSNCACHLEFGLISFRVNIVKVPLCSCSSHFGQILVPTHYQLRQPLNSEFLTMVSVAMFTRFS